MPNRLIPGVYIPGNTTNCCKCQWLERTPTEVMVEFDLDTISSSDACQNAYGHTWILPLRNNVNTNCDWYLDLFQAGFNGFCSAQFSLFKTCNSSTPQFYFLLKQGLSTDCFFTGGTGSFSGEWFAPSWPYDWTEPVQLTSVGLAFTCFTVGVSKVTITPLYE